MRTSYFHTHSGSAQCCSMIGFKWLHLKWTSLYLGALQKANWKAAPGSGWKQRPRWTSGWHIVWYIQDGENNASQKDTAKCGYSLKNWDLSHRSGHLWFHTRAFVSLWSPVIHFYFREMFWNGYQQTRCMLSYRHVSLSSFFITSNRRRACVWYQRWYLVFRNLNTDTLPDRWRPACGRAESSPCGIHQTSQLWSPSQSHLQWAEKRLFAMLANWEGEDVTFKACGHWPCSSLSSSLEPVVTWMISALLWWNSVAVVKPIGTSLAASVWGRGENNGLGGEGERRHMGSEVEKENKKKVAKEWRGGWREGGEKRGRTRCEREAGGGWVKEEARKGGKGKGGGGQKEPNKDDPHQNLVSLGFADALDLEQLLLGSVGHGLDGVEAGVLQLFDVAAADSTLLHTTQRSVPLSSTIRTRQYLSYASNIPLAWRVVAVQSSPPPPPPQQLGPLSSAWPCARPRQTGSSLLKRSRGRSATIRSYTGAITAAHQVIITWFKCSNELEELPMFSNISGKM